MWVRTISARALEAAGGTPVYARGHIVYVTKVGEKYYGVEAVCPHSRCIMATVDKEALRLVCQCHHASFSLETGEMLEPPSVAPQYPLEKGRRRLYRVREKDGFVEIEIPD